MLRTVLLYIQVCLLPLVAASYHTRPWQHIIRYYNISYIPLGLRRTWCNGRMRRLGLITVRLPYLLPHCGFPFPASQLGKSYVRKKAMQWICRRFTPPSSTALLFPAPSYTDTYIDTTSTTLAGGGSSRNFMLNQRVLMYGSSLQYTGCSSLWMDLCSYATCPSYAPN